MKKILLLFAMSSFVCADSYKSLTLKNAIEIVKKKNLEINIAKFEEQIKIFDKKIASGYSFGKLDLTQNMMRSNDSGNVFGFKLKNREATFNDFGFDEFLGQMGGLPDNANELLNTQPNNLNFPNARNFYETKLTFELPLYTGGKLSRYRNIASSMQKLAILDREKIVSTKIYEVKKTFYDISLLNNFYKNLMIIKNNIEKLENTVREMYAEGYAKQIDILEVKAKKANVVRMLNEVKSNRELSYQFLNFLLDSNVDSIKEGYETPPLPQHSLSEMLKSNIDIAKAKTGLKITDDMVAVQKSNFKPMVGMFAEYGSSDDNFLNEFTHKDFYTIGVQVKINLFNGMIDKNSLEKARVTNLKTAQQVILAKKGIKLKISKTLTEIKNFNFHIDSLKEEIKLSKKIYENYLGRYKEKLVSINDVIIKQSQDIQRVLKLLKIQNSRNQKIFELEKIANRGEL